MTPAEIAGARVSRRKTVRNHVEHIYTKIGATNRVVPPCSRSGTA